MKLLSSAALTLLALVGSSNAQYFSAGWSPGQKMQDEAATATVVSRPSETAVAPKATPFSFSSLLDINKLLTSEPAVAIFSKFGVNITERVQAAQDLKIWDERVELITDDNFNDLIVNEPLTEQEEKDRVWIIVISVTTANQEGISKYLDNVFDAAFNETHLAGDLPHVKWGRIDYLNVTHITTKWGIWQAPYLVVLTDRGQALHDALREFLQVDGWKQTPPWEWIMDFQAKWFTKIYNTVTIVPRWALLFFSGSIGSVIIGLLHRPSKKAAPAAQPKAKPITPAVSSASATSTSTTAKAVPSAPTTDSEHESSAAPAKRTSARQRKPRNEQITSS
ncbi:hypothetical protein BDZ97DRAFT_1795371 [Flammula alnicola]|nr:hypothetical protein BDZ97DRAFT_1795371 [Flammula alnicola]